MPSKVIKLTETDLNTIVSKILKEQKEKIYNKHDNVYDYKVVNNSWYGKKKNGGKWFSLKKYPKSIKKLNNTYPNALGKQSSVSDTPPKVTSKSTSLFKSEEEGNEFRGWMNKYYPDTSKKLQLDVTGKYDNSYIKKALNGKVKRKDGSIVTFGELYSIKYLKKTDLSLFDRFKKFIGYDEKRPEQEKIDLKNKVTNVIVSDSINRAYVKDIDFNSLKSTGKVTGIMEPGTNACATFVNKFTDKFNGVGDAWLSYRLDTKLGDTIFSKFKGLDKSQQETAIKLWKQLHKEGGGKIEDGSNKSNGNVKSFIKGLANKGGNPSDLQLDDIVGIFYEPSTHHEQAFYHGGEAWFKGGEAGSNINKGIAWGMNTHLGIVGAIKDGKPLIFHNIGGNVISEPPSNLNITWVKRHSQSTPIDASTIKNV